MPVTLWAMAPKARWWEIRRAQNRKPATYTCPLCGALLPALSEHMLLLPEGEGSRRRHAHTECVMRARRQGQLPTQEQWRRSQPGAARQTTFWSRLRRAWSR